MRLRTKTFVTVGLTMLVLFVLLFGGAVATLTGQYQEAERQDSEAVATRLADSLAGEVRHLAEMVEAAAARNDTYEFVRTGDIDSLPAEYDPDVVSHESFGFAVFLDNKGHAVRAQAVDIDLQQPTEVSAALVREIEQAQYLRFPGDPHGEVSGLMQLSGGVALIAAHAVTSPDMYATPVGTLVHGRYFDANTIDRISGATGLDVKVMPPPLETPSAAVSTGSTHDLGERASWWGPVDRSTYSAFVRFSDLLGQPAVVLGAEFPRRARASMDTAIGFAGIALFAMCLATTWAVIRLMDRFVIGRVANLSSQVREIGLTGDSSRRVQCAGTDEIADLCDRVNGMLASLQGTEHALVVSLDERDEKVRQRTHELSVSEARHRELIDSMADAVFSVDLNGRVVLVNQQAEAVMGRSKDELVGTLFRDLATVESAELIDRHLRGSVAPGTVWTLEALLHARDRSPVPVELRAAPFTDMEGQVTGTQWIARDMTERQRFESQLIHLANHDALTGLANRRAFEAALEFEIAGALRDDEHGAVIWFDLDDFKDINDTLGHAAGDEALVLLSAALRRNVRASNLLARVGGDEFAVLMPRADREEADVTARRILNAITTCTCSVAGHSVRVGASIGVVFFPEDGSSVQEILSNADAAMYRAKEGGRGRVFLRAGTNEPEALHVSRMKWNERITLALQNDAFLVYAQPVLDLRTHKIVRHELLIRMRGEGNSLYPPADFLPVAERLGLISEIDEWMLGQAVSILERDASGRTAVEVNLSAKVFTETGMVALVAAEIARTGVDPGRLGFEITETAMIADMARARWFTACLRELGCRVSLDDFGTGFSSFNYLKHLPVSCVKIDGSFVRGLATSEEDRCLIRGIREMCHGLGVEVLAEGVEDEATLLTVTDLGLEYAQGHHIGHPRPVTESGALEV